MMKSVKLGVLAASILQLSVLTVGLVSTTEQVYAQGCTNSSGEGVSGWGCYTYNSGWGFVGGDGGIQATAARINLAGIGTNSKVSFSTANVGSTMGNINIVNSSFVDRNVTISATLNATWDQTRQAYTVSNNNFAIRNVRIFDSGVSGHPTVSIPSANSSFSNGTLSQSFTVAIPRGTRVLALGMSVDVEYIGSGNRIPATDHQLLTVQLNNTTVGQINLYLAHPESKPACQALADKGERRFRLDDIAVDATDETINNRQSNTESFSIVCPSNVGVKISVSDINTPENTTNVLTNKTGDDYATGAGVRLYMQNTQMKMKHIYSVTNSTNQESTVTIPFYAKYHRPATGWGAGAVEANATVTLSYQ